MNSDFGRLLLLALWIFALINVIMMALPLIEEQRPFTQSDAIQPDAPIAVPVTHQAAPPCPAVAIDRDQIYRCVGWDASCWQRCFDSVYQFEQGYKPYVCVAGCTEDFESCVWEAVLRQTEAGAESGDQDGNEWRR